MISRFTEEGMKLKAQLIEEIDEYLGKLEIISNQDSFDINVLERLMVENQEKMKAVVNEANSAMASKIEADVKKKPKMQKCFRENKKRAEVRGKNHMRQAENTSRLLLLPLLWTQRSAVR